MGRGANSRKDQEKYHINHNSIRKVSNVEKVSDKSNQEYNHSLGKSGNGMKSSLTAENDYKHEKFSETVVYLINFMIYSKASQIVAIPKWCLVLI